MPAITYAAVATAIGRPISDPAEQAQVTQWIADVELILSARIDDLSALDQALLAYVEREAVVARMRYRRDRNSLRTSKPEDATDTGEEHYFLRVLDPWWVLLLPQGDVISTAYSISTSPSA